MDYAALRAEILTGPRSQDCVGFVVTNDMPKQVPHDLEIADILNAESGIRIVEDFCNDIEIIARLGPTTAATILDKLDVAALTSSVLKRAMRAIESDRGIDLGHAQTRAILDQLQVSLVLTTQEVTLLKALAERPSSRAYEAVNQPVTVGDISIALRGNAQFTPE